jgi:hypothetical protein
MVRRFALPNACPRPFVAYFTRVFCMTPVTLSFTNYGEGTPEKTLEQTAMDAEELGEQGIHFLSLEESRCE